MEGGDFGRFNHLFVCLFVYCRYSFSFIYFYCYYYTIILFLTNRGSKNDSFLWGQSQSQSQARGKANDHAAITLWSHKNKRLFLQSFSEIIFFFDGPPSQSLQSIISMILGD